MFLDEPGEFDPRKNRPVHHIRKGPKRQRVEKHNMPRENNTIVTGMIGTTAILKCNVGLSDVTVTFLI